MQKIDTKKISEGVKALIERGATLKQLKGVTNAELEAVYSLAFGYYRTGKFDEAKEMAEAANALKKQKGLKELKLPAHVRERLGL